MLNTIGGPVDGAKRTDSIGYGIVRPRIALPKPGDPGPADTYPLPDFPVKAATPASPSTPAAEHEQVGATVAKDDGGSTVLGVAVGAGAVVMLGVVAAGVVVRRRRRPGPAMYGPATSGQIPQPGPVYEAPPPRRPTSQGPADGW
ncbi:hypothetical protein ACIPWY_31265 [Streptomyces sp. NPDC090032]|uniref:hypothetical protein n=1 Tax=Streptomyces sp. NPDC090032 TaxID=3365925 RepID=UPI00380C22D7